MQRAFLSAGADWAVKLWDSDRPQVCPGSIRLNLLNFEFTNLLRGLAECIECLGKSSTSQVRHLLWRPAGMAASELPMQ